MRNGIGKGKGNDRRGKEIYKMKERKWKGKETKGTNGKKKKKETERKRA